MNKVVIKTKSVESRNSMLKLIKEGLKTKCSGWVPGGHSVDRRFKDRNDMSYIGVFCDKITIYYD